MTEIKIKDLRGVGDVELNLDDTKRVFVFFGSNGVGKTKTLEALALFSFLKLNNLSDFSKNYFFDDSDLVFKSLEVTSKEFSEKVNLGDFETREIISLDKQVEAFSLKQDVFNNFEKIFDSICLISINSKFYSDKSPHIAELINSKNNDVRNWIINQTNLINPYQKNGEKYKSIIDSFLESLNTFDKSIEKTLSIDNSKIFFSVAGQERELSELSSGFSSLIKIIQSIISAYSAFTNATDLLNVKGVVLIDEIESHLHIEWQTKIVPTLKNLFPNTTFYIATHSPLVLSQLAEGEAYLLKRDDDNVVRSSVINSPNTRLLANVMRDTFDVDLNQLKRNNIANIDQTKVKQKLLALMNEQEK